MLFFLMFFLLYCPFLSSSPLYSPTWGFSLDLPEGYEYSGGDNKDRFSFESKDGALFDLIVYYAAPGKSAPYSSVDALANDVQRRLNNLGEIDFFEYRHKKTAIMELSFQNSLAGGRSVSMAGWALCMELGVPNYGTGRTNQGRGGTLNNSQSGRASGTQDGQGPLLLAMAYGPSERSNLQILHFSALDSISPEEQDRYAPGPITEYGYPRENRIVSPVFGLGIEAQIYEEDAEAAQALVDREFLLLSRHINTPQWKEAWIRFYRAIYRDSFERLADIAFQVERKLNVPPRENRDFADQALQWVQSFTYERDLEGSDFVNLVSAAIEGRGDCDPRAMLWAIILRQANIPSAIMVSRTYSHAMGLADLPGAGARFEIEGQEYLVAETTAKVSIGLIGETVSEISEWLGIPFE